MEIKRMSNNIINMLNKSYGEYIGKQCMDVIYIMDICNIYANQPEPGVKGSTNSKRGSKTTSPKASTKSVTKSATPFATTFTTKSPSSLANSGSKQRSSPSLSEIDFPSPFFERAITIISHKNRDEVINSPAFLSKYGFFIKTIYACLKIDVGIFDIEHNLLTLKNNHNLIKALELHKKTLLNDHIGVLKLQLKNISMQIAERYDEYLSTYTLKMKIVDRMLKNVNTLIDQEIFSRSDNLLTLLVPYFYEKMIFIEEYDGSN